MGLGEWLREMFGVRQPSGEMVPFLDVKAGRVVRIPASELRPHAIQVQLQGSEELVWALPEQLRQGEIKHANFDERVRDDIRRIHAAFAEHRSLSVEEWEDGFLRDAHPDREIARWLHAADVYEVLTANETVAERRSDVYRCVVTCLTTSPSGVRQVLKPKVLSNAEAERVIKQFFGSQA